MATIPRSTALLSILAALVAPVSALAATLSLVPDALVYESGDTITISLVGDSQGGADRSLFAALILDPAVLVDPHVVRSMPPPQAGNEPWLMGATGPTAVTCPYQAGKCMLLNSIYPVIGAFAGVDPANEPFTYAVLTAIAGDEGVHALQFVSTPTTQRVDFFGLTSAQGVAITIVNPEPATAGLLALGLAGMTLARRRLRMPRR